MKEKILMELNCKANKLEDKLLKDLFSIDNWYIKVDIDTFVNVLIKLGYSKEEALNVHKDLLINYPLD